jgi:hypothetical protein
MKTFLLVLLFTVFTVSARADDIVDLNVQSTWFNFPLQIGWTYNFVERWDKTNNTSRLLYASETGNPKLFMDFQFTSTPSAGGVNYYDQYGDGYQIIAGAYNGVTTNDPLFGTPGIYNRAEVDIFCHNIFNPHDQSNTVCEDVMQDGFLDGQANVQSSISITQASPISTPEISSGASLAAGLLLSSAFILYNRRRKEILCRPMNRES